MSNDDIFLGLFNGLFLDEVERRFVLVEGLKVGFGVLYLGICWIYCFVIFYRVGGGNF